MATIKELPQEDQPRERLEQDGAGSLSNSELIAVVLGSGTKDKNAIAIAQELLKKEGVGAMASLSISRLSKCKGIGKVKACQLIAAVELGKRALSTPARGAIVKNAADAVKIAAPSLLGRDREVFVALYLSSSNRVIKKAVVSIGSLNKSIVHAREVFKPAIEEAAAGVVVLHNHPSGDPSPTAEDIETTKELENAGKLLGIPLLDHIVVGKNAHVSIRELGVI